MTTLEWFEKRLGAKMSRVTFNDSLPFPLDTAGFAIFDSQNDMPSDVSPMPAGQDHGLSLAYRDGKTAHYWVPDSVLDDGEIDIWELVGPSLIEQFGIISPVPARE
jgi:hypothetical protein